MIRYTSIRKHPPPYKLGKGGIKSRLLFYTALFTLLVALSYYLFFVEITEKRYNKIMCYYITRAIISNAPTFEQKIISIRDFVNENVHSIHGYDNRLDTRAIEKLISGIGWCDQQSRVFMQLVRSVGITSRLLFLRYQSGSSPHSVAEVLDSNGRWVIVDTAYKLDLINKNGDFATQTDIKDDLIINC